MNVRLHSTPYKDIPVQSFSSRASADTAGVAKPATASSTPRPSAPPKPAGRPETSEGRLAEYLSRPGAQVAKPPLGLEGFAYGSRPRAETELVTISNGLEAIVVAHGTPPLAGKLFREGLGNFGNPDWMKLVAQAIQQDGGLGSSEEGSLAFSSESGFVRLRHPGFSPEHVRRMPALFLQTGWPIERLPCQ